MITTDPAKLAKLDAQKRIAELKQFLRDTDHVALSDYDQDKPEIKAQRQAWRIEVRQLEAL